MKNRIIFEEACGASRRKLDGDWCGYEYEGQLYLCFQGHEHFDNDEQWDAKYNGPDFFTSLEWGMKLGDVFDRQERRGYEIYLNRLVNRVFPRWKVALNRDDVLDFWFALAHASAADRAEAAVETIDMMRTNVPE